MKLETKEMQHKCASIRAVPFEAIRLGVCLSTVMRSLILDRTVQLA